MLRLESLACPCLFFALIFLSCHDRKQRSESKYYAKILAIGKQTDQAMTILLHDHTQVHILCYQNPLLSQRNTPPRDSIDLCPTWGDDDRLYFVYRVPYGEIHELQWSNGDKIVLDAGSSLQFTDIDTDDRRFYYLEGKATFTPAITKNIVGKEIRLSGDIVLTTHGQKVYVDAFKDCHRKLITAYQRGLEIRSKDWHYTLTGNTTAAISADGQFSVVPKIDTFPDNHWPKDLHAIDLTIPEIIADLNRWYNKNIVIHSQDSGIHITGIFSRTDSLDRNLKILSDWYHVKYSIVNK